MFRSFKEVEQHVLGKGIKKCIVLCGAHYEPALEAVVNAKRQEIVSAILIGDETGVKDILAKLKEDAVGYEIINEPDEVESANMAIRMVREGKADIPMKGLMQSSSYLRAVLNKETGILPEGKILNQCTVFEYPDQNRLMFAGDCAMIITPTMEEKIQIIKNSVELAKCFGIKDVKVAVLSALEKVNPKIASTVEADELSKMDWEDLCTVEGPFALDNAVDLEAAKHKGITGKVAGNADILAMSNLDMGNVFTKALTFFAHLKTGSALCGTQYPVIFTSRTDTPDGKYNSILTAIMQSIHGR